MHNNGIVRRFLSLYLESRATPGNSASIYNKTSLIWTPLSRTSLSPDYKYNLYFAVAKVYGEYSIAKQTVPNTQKRKQELLHFSLKFHNYYTRTSTTIS
jgi:hypothetical protein